jgi:ATP-binding cassette, subfamily C (CFTR/MRP), member 1
MGFHQRFDVVSTPLASDHGDTEFGRSTHIRIAPESGAELHRRLLSTIVGFVHTTLPAAAVVLMKDRTPLLYFSTTDIGVILNRFVLTPCRACSMLTCCRFSQDMQLVDGNLPPSVLSISNRKFFRTPLGPFCL